MDNDMRLSHVLYRVKDLHEAVKDFTDMGFTVRYGTKKEKAFNALIWFEEGPFIELFTISRGAKIFTSFLKLIGKGPVARRFEYFIRADYGWVEYALENDRYELDTENAQLKEMGYTYATLPASRTDTNGLKLRWTLSIPLDLGFPFLMSAYKPSPRPKHIEHPNGAKSVRELTWGVNAKNMDHIARLTADKRLTLTNGNGFQKIEIEGWDATILNKEYYK